MSYCPKFNLIVWQVSAPGTVIMSRVRCKMWSCPFCCKQNRADWLNFLSGKLQRVSSNWWFVTLTAHEYDRSAAGSLKNLRKGIDNVMKRVRRVWDKVNYVRVFEKHKKGAYHAHLIVSEITNRVRRWVNRNKTVSTVACPDDFQGKTWGVQTWFRRACRACKMGYMVTVRRLDSDQQAVRYVVKYMTKDAQQFYAKGLHRIQTSTGIGSPVKKKRGGWTAAKYVWTSDMPEGANLVDLNTKEVIPYEKMLQLVAYP